MQGFLQQLFDYNFLCNKLLIEQCGAMAPIPGECQRLFSHILDAHHIWNQRILGEAPEYGLWEIHPHDVWGDIHYNNQRTTFEIMTNSHNFQERVEYTNSQGRPFTSDIGDILFQIINHSTHHRGQILAQLRAHGTEPPKLDYIFYRR